jgi:hypothetical protein
MRPPKATFLVRGRLCVQRIFSAVHMPPKKSVAPRDSGKESVAIVFIRLPFASFFHADSEVGQG